MQRLAACFCLVAGGVVLCAADAQAQQQSPTVSVMVVSKNANCSGGTNHRLPCARDCDCPGGTCASALAAPTTTISGRGGDRFVLEFYAKEWSPSASAEALSNWQVQLERSVLASGLRGTLDVRTGFRCCMPRPFFNSSYECQDISTANGCSNPNGIGICRVQNLEEVAGVYIERYREDYALFPDSEVAAIDISSNLFIRWSSTLASDRDADIFTLNDPPKYLASLALEASDDACGVFQIDLTSGFGNTALFDVLQPITPLSLEGATIDLGSCDCKEFLASVPDNCTVDARQPTDISGVATQTIDAVTVTLDCSCDQSNSVAASQFLTTASPSGAQAPTVVSANVVSCDGTTSDVLVTFSGPLEEQAWSCLRYQRFPLSPISDPVCFGILPADVGGDSLTEISDLSNLVDCLGNPAVTCSLEQCDLDRSGTCTPADILRVIDLLKGAAAFMVWEGEGILDGTGAPVPCPATP